VDISWARRGGRASFWRGAGTARPAPPPGTTRAGTAAPATAPDQSRAARAARFRGRSRPLTCCHSFPTSCRVSRTFTCDVARRPSRRPGRSAGAQFLRRRRGDRPCDAAARVRRGGRPAVCCAGHCPGPPPSGHIALPAREEGGRGACPTRVRAAPLGRATRPAREWTARERIVQPDGPSSARRPRGEAATFGTCAGHSESHSRKSRSLRTPPGHVAPRRWIVLSGASSSRGMLR
jgi:hypothetical protein